MDPNEAVERLVEVFEEIERDGRSVCVDYVVNIVMEEL